MFINVAQNRKWEINTPQIMGIINITHDSFYENSRAKSIAGLLVKATQMIAEGAQILDIGAQSTRPGAEIINDLGGLHRFMNWDKVILTDSGGFQGWSLPTKKVDTGIQFKNVYDGSRFLMTPELSIKTQNLLGSDIAMIFDYVVDIDANNYLQNEAIQTTEHWAKIAKQVHNNNNQALFGIVQGGLVEEYREKSALSMVNLDFDGYAIGGLALGESREERKSIVNFTTDFLPLDKPRYVMGLGDTLGLIDLISEGIDMFDCVWPARLARHGKLITGNTYINIKNQKFASDPRPIDDYCPCFTCKNYSRAFLKHLLKNEQTTAWLYLTIHNLPQFQIKFQLHTFLNLIVVII